MNLRQFVIAATVAAVFSGVSSAQQRVADPPAVPYSRWQSDIERLDEALQARLLAAQEPRALWVAGQLYTGDPASQVMSLAAARTRMPSEKLFVASLALACMQLVEPPLPACDAVDRVADWATRDADNGLPSLLLAERARRRNNSAAMIAHLDEAATRTRFDDYGARGDLFFWEEIRALSITADSAAKAELAAGYATRRASLTGNLLQSLCRNALKGGQETGATCVAAGVAMADRAATWNLRALGAQMAFRNAGLPDVRAGAQQRRVRVHQQFVACSEGTNSMTAAFASNDAAERERAVRGWESRLKLGAELGEVAACERLSKRS